MMLVVQKLLIVYFTEILLQDVVVACLMKITVMPYWLIVYSSRILLVEKAVQYTFTTARQY